MASRWATGEIGAWRGQDSPLDPEIIKLVAVDDYMNRYYRSGDAELGLYVGYYKSQREGEALHSPMQCLPGAGWEPTRTESIEVTGGTDGRPRTINKLFVEKGLNRMLVLYWYQTENRVTASEYWRKIFLVKDAAQASAPNRLRSQLSRTIRAGPSLSACCPKYRNNSSNES